MGPFVFIGKRDKVFVYLIGYVQAKHITKKNINKGVAYFYGE